MIECNSAQFWGDHSWRVMAPLLTDGFIPGTSRTSHFKLLPRRRICQKQRLELYVDIVLTKDTEPNHPMNSSKDLLSLQFLLERGGPVSIRSPFPCLCWTVWIKEFTALLHRGHWNFHLSLLPEYGSKGSNSDSLICSCYDLRQESLGKNSPLLHSFPQSGHQRWVPISTGEWRPPSRLSLCC